MRILLAAMFLYLAGLMGREDIALWDAQVTRQREALAWQRM